MFLFNNPHPAKMQPEKNSVLSVNSPAEGLLLYPLPMGDRAKPPNWTTRNFRDVEEEQVKM